MNECDSGKLVSGVFGSSFPPLSPFITVTNLASDMRFASLGTARRIWAISAIHGEADRLMDLHDQLFQVIRPGDRVVYMGNYMGHGEAPCETLDEMLTFRRSVLALPGMMPQDFIYLRGHQEEMWEKLQQLQFAPNPKAVLMWMLNNGISSTLESYHVNPNEGLRMAGEGVMSLTRWTASIRSAIRRKPGHDIFQCQLRRAAFTTPDDSHPILFVHAGVNPDRPLQDQGDALWWGGQNFSAITHPYAPFSKVIRGFDPNHAGLHINCVTTTIDGGCGFGGDLICAGFESNGEIFGLLRA